MYYYIHFRDIHHIIMYMQRCRKYHYYQQLENQRDLEYIYIF